MTDKIVGNIDMDFHTLVICGEEMVSFEIGRHIKVVSLKLDPTKIKYKLGELKKQKIKAQKVIVTSAIDDLLNKDNKKIINSLGELIITEDSIDFTTI